MISHEKFIKTFFIHDSVIVFLLHKCSYLYKMFCSELIIGMGKIYDH